MNRINVQGVHLETAYLPGPNDKAPLVFLHEGLGSVAMWQQKSRHWPTELCAASGRAGWMVSRRGYGNSDPVPDVRGESRWENGWHIGRHEPDYMHLEAWQALPAWLSAIGVENPVLIGHSDGATIALLHASRCPVSACIAMAPHVFVEPMAIAAIEAAKNAFIATDGAFRQRLAPYHADVDNAFWQWNDVWLSTAFSGFDIRDECREIRQPLLSLQGLDDEYGSLQQLKDIQQAAPHSHSLAIPHCGHSPHRNQPDQLTTAICNFLIQSTPR